MTSPTARSLEWLRERGWLARVVERWNPWSKKRIDLFGGDILAIHPAQKKTLLVQATSGTNHVSRVKKSKENPEVSQWIAGGNEFEVHSWKQRKGNWEVRIEKIGGDAS